MVSRLHPFPQPHVAPGGYSSPNSIKCNTFSVGQVNGVISSRRIGGWGASFGRLESVLFNSSVTQVKGLQEGVRQGKPRVPVVRCPRNGLPGTVAGSAGFNSVEVAEGRLQPLGEGARVAEVDVVAGPRVQRDRAEWRTDGDVLTSRSGNGGGMVEPWAWGSRGGRESGNSGGRDRLSLGTTKEARRTLDV